MSNIITMEDDKLIDTISTDVSKLSITGKKKKSKRNYPIYWCIKINPYMIREILTDIDPIDIAHLKLQDSFHITLLYNRTPPTDEIIQKYTSIIGKSVSITLPGYAVDEKGCTLIVDKTFEYADMCTNEHPHISIGNIEGVKPVYNNVLVEKAVRAHENTIQSSDINTDEFSGKIKLFCEPIHITGIVGSV